MRFLRKYWLFLVLAILAVVLVFLWIQGRSKKEEVALLPSLPKVPFPNIVGQSLAVVVDFVIPEVALPLDVPLYQVSPKRLTDAEIDALARNFEFPEKPSNVSRDSVLGEYRLWLSTTHSLSVRVSPLEVSISQDAGLSPVPTDGALPDPLASSEYLKRVVTTNNLETPGVVFQTGDSREINGGNILQTQLKATVEGVEIVDINPYIALVGAGLRKDRGLFYFSYRVGFSNPTNRTLYPAKDQADIKQNLLTEGKIMSLGDPFSEEATEARALTPTRIEITSIKSALLFFPERPTFLFPIYVMEGVADTEVGEEPIVIYLPSVKSNYLQETVVSPTP